MCRRRTAKNKVHKSGVFFAPGKHRATHHHFAPNHHNIHHDLPAKKHHKSQKPPVKPPSTTPEFFRKIPKSAFSLKGFSGEVIKRKSKKGEHDDADPVMVEGVVVAETPDGAVGGGFIEFDEDPKEPDVQLGGGPLPAPG